MPNAKRVAFLGCKGAVGLQTQKGPNKKRAKINMRWRVSAPFLAWLCLLVLTDETQLAGWFLWPVILHELGHLAMLALFGCPPGVMTLSFVGVGLSGDPQGVSKGKRALVYAAGSLMNLLLFLIFGFACQNDSHRLTCLALPHLAVGLFNLLPMPANDGGRLLGLFLQDRLSERVSRLVLQICGISSVGVLLFLAFYQLFTGGFSLSLLVSIGYAVWLLFHQ